MRVLFALLAVTILLTASSTPAAYSAGINPTVQEHSGLYMQTQSPPAEDCFLNVPVFGCIKNPINLAWVNDTLLNIVKPGIIGLGEILDQFQNSSQNIFTQTPAFWDLAAIQALRVVTLFIAYAVALQILGFWVAIKMIVVEVLKRSGATPDFVMKSETPEGTTVQFLIAALLPAVMYEFGPWLIGVNNDFCSSMNINLRDILLPPPNSDNFLVLIVMAVPYLLDDIVILGALGLRFFFLGLALMVSVLAACAALKEEWKDLFQMFLALFSILTFFQLGVMILLWFYLTFVQAYAGATGMTITHTLFMTGTAFIVWKSRKWLWSFIQRYGRRRYELESNGSGLEAVAV